MNQNHAEPERSILIKRLLESETIGYRIMLRKRYKSLRDAGVFSYENVNRMLVENENQLGDAIAANAKLWPVDSPDYYDTLGFQEELEIFRTFVKQRIILLDAYFEMN